MVYDAVSNSAFAIPLLDPPRWPVSLATIKCLGMSAAILRLHHGDNGAYVLAELVTMVHPGLPEANLYLWWSSSTSNSWMRMVVHLPLLVELCGPMCFFHIDMAFAFGGSSVSWADLLTSVLIYDLFASEGPMFSFVSLLPECCSYTPKNLRLALNTQESVPWVVSVAP
jgi:hypothetical protein